MSARILTELEGRILRRTGKLRRQRENMRTGEGALRPTWLTMATYRQALVEDLIRLDNRAAGVTLPIPRRARQSAPVSRYDSTAALAEYVAYQRRRHEDALNPNGCITLR